MHSSNSEELVQACRNGLVVKRRLLVIASHDSQLKVASSIADEFVAQGWTMDVRLAQSRGQQVSSRQISDFSGFVKFEFCSTATDEILRDCMSFAAILIVLGGQLTQKLCHAFYERVRSSSAVNRPILITGFVGVGLFDTYIGYQRRLLSDVLFLNADKDLQDCEAVCRELGIRHDGLVVSGLPFLGPIKTDVAPPSEISAVLFAGQPDVPGRLVERLFLLQKMLAYARKFPDRTVYFKPRHKPAERTLHRTNYHYETLLRCFVNAADIPKNFQIVYGPISQYLASSQVVVTISSTVILEAIERNLHPVLMSDLGISEDYGNEYFMGSGLLCSFDNLLRDQLPSVNWDWLMRHIRVAGGGPGLVFDAAVAAIETNGKQMRIPYELARLEPLVRCRLEIEAENESRVLKPWVLLKFFAMRAIKERRIL